MDRARTAVMALLAIGGIVCIAGCDSTAEDQPAAITPVEIALTTEGPAAPSIRTNGLLANEDEFRLSFKVGGVIKRIPVAEGQHVRRGQRLAEIEQTEINAQVEQARQSYEKAKRDADRGERLHADNVISLEQLQDLRTQVAMTQAALSSAEFNWNYAAIIAPHDGTVLRKLAEERELVAAGNPIFVLGAQDKGFVVRAGLADREIVQVKLGDTVQVRLDALPDAALQGKLTEVASAADPASGMFRVEVAIDPTELPLKSGLVAKLAITPATAKAGKRVYVPIAAIVEGNERSARVFVLDHGQARRRDVQVAFIEGEQVALSDGLKPGEQVITGGAQYLEDGERVAVTEPAEPVAATERERAP